MDFLVPFRRRRPIFGPRPGAHGKMRSLLAVAAGCMLIAGARAQTPAASMPNAPAPDQSALYAILSNTKTPLAAGIDAESTASPLPAGEISLYTVVDFALRNSRTVKIAEADQQRARGAWKETRDAFIPNLSVGSGLGPPSYGFPLGNPTLFNINSTSLAFSFSQGDYIHSARATWKAATLSLKNARQQVILDASLDYIELDKTREQIAALHEAAANTRKLLALMSDRLQAGLETNIQMTQARLTSAQIKLRAIQMEDHADELRRRLADLTGLNADLIAPAASSIPPLPDLDLPSRLQADARPPAVQAAEATADAKMYAARGDKNQNYRPTVGFGFQYARFATFTNYSQYYNHFTYNNVEAGIQAVWPLYDPIRRDKSEESKAEAVRARQQAELARIQNDEGNTALWHSLRELQAQEQVADLQQQLAQDTLAATITQMNHGPADANGAPITPLQAQQQRIDERTSFVDLQDAQLNVIKVKLNLLSAAGELEDWVQESVRPKDAAPSVAIEPPASAR